MSDPTIRSMVRDVKARRAAERIYVESYERLAELAQVQYACGMVLQASITRHRAEIALRAYRAEAEP
jgi:hypothetical protein